MKRKQKRSFDSVATTSFAHEDRLFAKRGSNSRICRNRGGLGTVCPLRTARLACFAGCLAHRQILSFDYLSLNENLVGAYAVPAGGPFAGRARATKRACELRPKPPRPPIQRRRTPRAVSLLVRRFSTSSRWVRVRIFWGSRLLPAPIHRQDPVGNPIQHKPRASLLCRPPCKAHWMPPRRRSLLQPDRTQRKIRRMAHKMRRKCWLVLRRLLIQQEKPESSKPSQPSEQLSTLRSPCSLREPRFKRLRSHLSLSRLRHLRPLN
jgi:hypothetical protein